MGNGILVVTLAGGVRIHNNPDLFSIRTEESYPDNYEDTVDQGQEEQAENARPRLTEQIENPDQYDTVFLGFPNWWGDMPMAVYSFLEEYAL